MSIDVNKKNQIDFLTIWYDPDVKDIDRFRARLLNETDHPLKRAEPADPNTDEGKKKINKHNTELRKQCLDYVVGLKPAERKLKSSTPRIDDQRFAKFVERRGTKMWNCRQLGKASSETETFSYPSKDFIKDIGKARIADWDV